MKNSEIKLFEINKELKKMVEIQNDLTQKLSTLIQEAVLEEKQPDLDFFLDNNAERKKKESKKKDA